MTKRPFLSALPLLLLLGLVPPPSADGAKSPKEPSLRFSGTLTSPQLPAPLRFRGEWSSAGRGFVALETPQGELLTGFDGTRPWTKRPDGLVRVAPPLERGKVAGELFRMLPGYPFVPGIPLKDLGPDGAFRRFELVAGAVAEVELDAQGRAIRSRAPGSEIVFDGFRKSGRFRWASSSVTRSGPRSSSEAKYESVEIAAALPADVGAVPFRGVRFARGSSGEVPFEGTSVMPILAAELETRSGKTLRLRLIADLASPVSTLAPAAFTAAGGEEAPLRIPRLGLGAVELEGAILRPADPAALAAIAERTGREIDGTLGADLLLRVSIALDLEKRKVRFVDPDGDPIRSQKDFEAPFRERNGVPLVPAAAGGVGFDLAIDTASPGGVVVPEEAAARFAFSGTVPLLTSGGRERATRLPAFFLGDAELPAVVRIGSPRPGAPQDLPSSGLGSLAGGYLVLEPERGLLRWRRREAAAAEPLSRAGFELVRREGKLVVSAVVEECPAAKSGIRPGDELVRIGSSASTSLPAARTLLGLAPGTKLRIVTRRAGADSELELVLGDLLPIGQAGRPTDPSPPPPPA